jgi:hypothetical protein
MNDKIKFKEYLPMMCELYDKTLSTTLADLYWKVLEPYSDEECIRAFVDIMHTGRYFPKPVDFVEAIRGTAKNRSTLAWLQAYETLKKIGNYQSVQFADPVIHSVIELMGGWPHFCEMLEDEAKWKQKEFERYYEVISTRSGKHPFYLPGTHEMENARTGWDVKLEIIQIGFEKLKLISNG